LERIEGSAPLNSLRRLCIDLLKLPGSKQFCIMVETSPFQSLLERLGSWVELVL